MNKRKLKLAKNRKRRFLRVRHERFNQSRQAVDFRISLNNMRQAILDFTLGVRLALRERSVKRAVIK